MTNLWGIDLGGTKVEGIILDAQYKPIVRERIPTESDQGYTHIVSRIAEIIAIISSKTDKKPDAIGIGTPGICDPKTGLMKNCNTTALIGKPFLSDLESLLGVPVIMANDANCFALAEEKMGAGRGARSIFGVIMGTGVGGGVIVEGTLMVGVNGIGGEWGHTTLSEDGPKCYCGRNGCVEKFISGPALESWYALRSGTHRPLSEIVARSKSGGDHVASATLERLCDHFGRALATVVNILDPERIVLGGGLSHIEELYTIGKERLFENIFHDRPQTVIVKNELGDSAGVFGAALLCQRGKSGR